MKIAFLTAGGIAPCLSASIGFLIKEYRMLNPNANTEFIGYLHGYRGLLTGTSIPFPPDTLYSTDVLLSYGGSPIGNSRVKLTNTEDCIQKGYVPKGDNPVAVAAEQLKKDDVKILHTIGGDDTNKMAGELADYLSNQGIELTIVGMPKTVDNDVYPIHQTLGAATAAEQTAVYFENIANENTTSSRHLIIHEIMGRNCGWLTAAAANKYRVRLDKKEFLPELLLEKNRWEMDEKDSINIFLSEGAGTETIVREIEASGQEVVRDAFGHVALDTLNPGEWFAKQFQKNLNADKVLVQKSGYFARSASPNREDLDLIGRSAVCATKSAMAGKSGVVGLDEENNNEISLIPFERIRGGKPFNINQEWFQEMLKEIGQTL
jgi:pyrophosphate--fructose-6-phosphate 1-phosphotransferase